jgi:hypothetical protein
MSQCERGYSQASGRSAESIRHAEENGPKASLREALMTPLVQHV